MKIEELIRFLDKENVTDKEMLNFYLDNYDFFYSEPDIKNIMISTINSEMTTETAVNILSGFFKKKI